MLTTHLVVCSLLGSWFSSGDSKQIFTVADHLPFHYGNFIGKKLASYHLSVLRGAHLVLGQY